MSIPLNIDIKDGQFFMFSLFFFGNSDSPLSLYLFSFLFGGVKSIQSAVLLSDTFNMPSPIFDG
jgi:hypothetical protein